MITAAWQVDENSLVFACPSSRGATYLVGVTAKTGTLTIIHDCPAIKANKTCWHLGAARDVYENWFWWQDTPQETNALRKKIKLSSDWVQIPVPKKAKWREVI